MSTQRWLTITGAFVVVALGLWFAADSIGGTGATVLRALAGVVIIGWLVFYLIDLKRDVQQSRAPREDPEAKKPPPRQRKRGR